MDYRILAGLALTLTIAASSPSARATEPPDRLQMNDAVYHRQIEIPPPPQRLQQADRGPQAPVIQPSQSGGIGDIALGAGITAGVTIAVQILACLGLGFCVFGM